MNEAQKRAFEGANPGADVTVEGLLALFITLTAALVVTWCVWVVVQAYKGWASNSTEPFAAGGHVLRAVLVVVLVFFVLGRLVR